MAEKKALENEEIKEYGQIELNENRQQHNIQLLSIIGEVEGHENASGGSKTTKYDHVLPALAQIEDDATVEGLLVLLNTSGGDVDAGLAIAEMIASLSIPTVSLVLGGGHSIGVPLAVAAKHSFIAPSATMTIHPVRMNGLMLGVPQTLEYFQRMQERITQFVTDNSHITPQRFYELAMNTEELVMDVGTVLDGPDAVKEGLIDSLGSLSDAIDCLYQMIDKAKKAEKKASKSTKKTGKKA